MDITSLDDWSFNKEIANFSLYLSGPLNKNIKTELNIGVQGVQTR